MLDGKSTRSGLSRELDFTPADRAEHLRRIAHISKLLNDQGIITICSFISPDDSIRKQVAEIIGKENFHMVHLNANLEYCRKNDEYGLYNKADTGELKYLPGVDMDFDIPTDADLNFTPENKEDNIKQLLDFLSNNKIYPAE